MSNGRKIFGFLKFIEDLKKFYSYLFDSSFDFINILKAFTILSSCFYHFLDNLVWASNVGMISRIITGNLNWKTSKNFFSLLKNFIKIITNFIDLKECLQATFETSEKDLIDLDDEKILNEMLKNRSTIRTISLDIIQLLIKLTTLSHSLKVFPFYSDLHPIFISLLGIVYSLISIFKLYYKNKEVQKKMLRCLKKSNEYLSCNQVNSMSQNNLAQNHFTRIKSFECSLLDKQPNHRLICDENYFDNYYVDFNTDYPTTTENVLRPNRGENRIF